MKITRDDFERMSVDDKEILIQGLCHGLNYQMDSVWKDEAHNALRADVEKATDLLWILSAIVEERRGQVRRVGRREWEAAKSLHKDVHVEYLIQVCENPPTDSTQTAHWRTLHDVRFIDDELPKARHYMEYVAEEMYPLFDVRLVKCHVGQYEQLAFVNASERRKERVRKSAARPQAKKGRRV